MENSGEWLITAVDATGVKGTDLFSKADLYVIIKFGGKTVKTKTVKNQDCPVWKETFSFPYINNDNSVVEVTVMDDDLFKDDKITVAQITHNQFPAFGEEKEYSIPLSHKNKDVGILHLRIKNASENRHSNNNYGVSSSSTSYNQSSLPHGNHNYGNNDLSNINNINTNHGGYDNTVLGGHSYGTHNNDGQVREIYHTITETRYVNGQLIPNQNTNYNNNNLNPNLYNDTTLRTHGDYSNLNANQHDYNNNNNNNISKHVYNDSVPTTASHNPISAIDKTVLGTAALGTALGGAALGTSALGSATSPYTSTSTSTTTASTLPTSTLPTSTLPAAAASTIPAHYTTDTTHKHKKKHKVRLPEKYHHYEDGNTSSTSESSNEGEKRRLAQNAANPGVTHNTY